MAIISLSSVFSLSKDHGHGHKLHINCKLLEDSDDRDIQGCWNATFASWEVVVCRLALWFRDQRKNFSPWGEGCGLAENNITLSESWCWIMFLLQLTWCSQVVSIDVADCTRESCSSYNLLDAPKWSASMWQIAQENHVPPTTYLMLPSGQHRCGRLHKRIMFLLQLTWCSQVVSIDVADCTRGSLFYHLEPVLVTATKFPVVHVYRQGAFETIREYASAPNVGLTLFF